MTPSTRASIQSFLAKLSRCLFAGAGISIFAGRIVIHAVFHTDLLTARALSVPLLLLSAILGLAAKFGEERLAAAAEEEEWKARALKRKSNPD
jgi:hypothetical protein